ncbi:MAG: hypothetical protein C0515_09820 [Novosphingobium sp.]|nr:hypothetical protein [Novosphingobium sp.]
MVSFENRSAPFDKLRAIGVFECVSTGSAEDCRSQPGMGRPGPVQKKTLGPGALDRGFLCAFVTLDRLAR